MRTPATTCICVLLFAADAQATMIYIDSGISTSQTPSPAPDVTTTGFTIRQDVPGETAENIVTEWHVDYSADDVGETFVLNEANAAEEGFDWSAAEWWLANRPAHVTISGRYNKGTVLGEMTPNIVTGLEPRLVIDELQEFRVEILEYFSSPIGSVRRVHWSMTVDAHAAPVPEPMTLAMLSPLLFIHRRSRTASGEMAMG